MPLGVGGTEGALDNLRASLRPPESHDSKATATVRERVAYTLVPGAEEVFTPRFLEYLVELHDRFGDRVMHVRARRQV